MVQMKTKEIPQLWCIDEVVCIPVEQVSRVQVVEKTAEIPQLQTVEKIAETQQTKMIQGTQVLRVRALHLSVKRHRRVCGGTGRCLQGFRAGHGSQRFGKQTVEIPAKSNSPIFVTIQFPQEIVYEHPAPLTGAALEGTNRQVGEKLADDVVSEMKDLKSDLAHIRELLGVLVRKEMCAETKAEIAARRLDRMEREQHEADDAEHEANLREALQKLSKAVKVLVDKWFVDKGHCFERAPTGEWSSSS